MDIQHQKHLHETLEKLEAYKPGVELVLSVYLQNDKNISGEKLSEDFQKLLRKSLATDDAQQLKTQIDTIDSFLWNTYDSQKHLSGIGFFAGKNMWEIIHHDFEIPNKCSISHKADIAPLVKALQKDARYLFVIADREKAELLTFYQGGLESYKEILDPGVPQKVKANNKEYYARNNIIIRHIQNHVHRHLQRISREVDTFIKTKPVHTVFIGGHKPMFHDIKHHLSRDLQKKLGGEFVTELNIPYTMLVKHAEKELEKYLTN